MLYNVQNFEIKIQKAIDYTEKFFFRKLYCFL